jgi:predicted nucleic acid-binding protein
MPGSVVDLTLPGVRIPDPIVVDTNIIVEYLLASFLTPSVATLRATQFFQRLIATNGSGLVMPTAFIEFFHAAVKVTYKHELGLMTLIARQSRYGYPVRNWQDLYKQDASILQAFLPDLHRLRNLLIANGLLFVAPENLRTVASARSHDVELIDLIGTYGLDSCDAAILPEARRYGLTDIVSMDSDMQRASPDFNIYTWI